MKATQFRIYCLRMAELFIELGAPVAAFVLIAWGDVWMGVALALLAFTLVVATIRARERMEHWRMVPSRHSHAVSR